jgi:RimJ/RimL family protein N-acetyltransferase
MDVSRAPLAAPRAPPRRWVAALARIARTHLLARFDRRRVVFRWQPEAVRPGKGDAPARRVTSLDELPNTIFREADADGQPRAWYRHFLDQGAVLWTAVEGGRALGSVWMLDAARVGAWYVPLESNAQVIYGVVTAPWARGRGIAAELSLAAAQGAAGAPVYLDCMAWNRPAQRAFEKAGFVPIAVAGSRWRESRAGPDA